MNRYRVELRDEEGNSSVWYGDATLIESAIAKAKNKHRADFGQVVYTLREHDKVLVDDPKARDFVYIKAAKVS